MLRKRFAAIVGAIGLLFGAQTASAGAIGLTLMADQDLGNLAVDDMFEVVIGLTGIDSIAAYTLDFSFGDNLTLVGADQLAATDIGGGFFGRANFILDPLVTGNRASVLTVGDPVRVDVGSNFPPGSEDTRAGLFALKFMVMGPGDGVIEVGILDDRADSISQPGGGLIELISPTVMTAYSVVPEPATATLMVAALAAAAALRRRR